MGLFGRGRRKGAAGDRLTALSRARVTLEAELGLEPGGVAAVCFKPLSPGEFVRAENELQQVLDAVALQSSARIERRSDDLGFEWLIVRERDFEELIGTIDLIGSEMQARGFGPQLLAAMFELRGGEQPVYFIYGYKSGTFWPFVPTGEKERDNDRELELKAKLENELPIEPDLSRWFGLFDAPL